MANDIITVANVQGHLDTDDTAWLNAEYVARGFGFKAYNETAVKFQSTISTPNFATATRRLLSGGLF